MSKKNHLREQNRIASWIESRRRSLIRFCCELIEAPSPNPPGDERAVVEVIRRQLDKLNLVDYRVIRSNPRRPNLLVYLKGTVGAPALLYNAHTDTKPIGEQRHLWRSDPLRATRKDGRIYGLGAADMKGAVAAFVYALAALRQVPLQGNLCLALTADEEAGSQYGAGYLVDRKKVRADVALIGEPPGVRKEWEYLHVGHRGSCCFKVRIHGTQRHSSISNMLPTVNASLKMAKVMSALKEQFRPRHKPHPYCAAGITLNVGVYVRGGVFYGVNPGFAEFGCDLRLLPGMTRARLKEDLDRFFARLKQQDQELQVEWEFEKPPLDWTEPTEVPSDLPLVRALQRASKEVLGFCPPLALYPATTDSHSFQTVAGIPTVPAFGAGMISLAHGPNEWVGIESVVQAAKIYALAAFQTLSTDSNP